MGRRPIPKSQCRLLTRSDARRYCGGLGEGRFDREVGPYVAVRVIGAERFYDRLELDAWVDQLSGAGQPQEIDWLSEIDNDLNSRPRR